MRRDTHERLEFFSYSMRHTAGKCDNVDERGIYYALATLADILKSDIELTARGVPDPEPINDVEG